MNEDVLLTLMRENDSLLARTGASEVTTSYSLRNGMKLTIKYAPDNGDDNEDDDE